MIHSTDTPAQFTAVSGHTHLFRREGGTYYLRVKVPHDLRPFVKKTEIRVSLRTKKLKEAVPAVNLEWLRVSRMFDEAEARRAGEKLETKSFVEDQSLLKALEPEDRLAVIDNRQADYMVLAGSPDFSREDHESYLTSLVNAQLRRWGIQPDSDNYIRAFPFFQKAIVESFGRGLDRLREHTPRRIEFQELSETSAIPPRPHSTTTLGELLNEFMEYQRTHHAETTPAAYETSVRALREELGQTTHLSDITKADIERVFALLARIPILCPSACRPCRINS